MSNTIKIQMTYSTVTPESAEHGDHADHGFYDCGGWTYSIADDDFQARCERVGREQALKDMTPAPVEFDDAEEAIEFLRNSGPFEASGSIVNANTWLTAEASQDRDYFEKGEETQVSYHLEGDPAIVVEVLQGALA